ncbi:hypothetical protein VPH35_028919 [Triticum aestivum]
MALLSAAGGPPQPRHRYDRRSALPGHGSRAWRLPAAAVGLAHHRGRRRAQVPGGGHGGRRRARRAGRASPAPRRWPRRARRRTPPPADGLAIAAPLLDLLSLPHSARSSAAALTRPRPGRAPVRAGRGALGAAAATRQSSRAAATTIRKQGRSSAAAYLASAGLRRGSRVLGLRR